MLVKIWISSANIWRHGDVRGFSLDLIYISRADAYFGGSKPMPMYCGKIGKQNATLKIFQNMSFRPRRLMI